MELEKVKNREDLEKIYSGLGLASTQSKIEFLRNEMGILAIRGAESNEEDDLYALEQIALLQLWDRNSAFKAA